MAFTERYASLAGGGTFDGTSEANAWTFSDAIRYSITGALVTGGTRINIKAGGTLTAGAVTLSGSAKPIIFRGYNSVTGDLDNYRRMNDGPLDITNYPVISVTGGPLVLGANNIFQNFYATGSIVGALIGGSAPDNWTIFNCKVANYSTSAASRTVLGDNDCRIIMSDLEAPTVGHGGVLDLGTNCFIYDTRIKGTGTDALVSSEGGHFNFCTFIGTNTGIQLANNSNPVYALNNTFYGLQTPIALTTAAQVHTHILINNHVTDGASYISGAPSPPHTVIDLYSRTRDLTNGLVGVDTVGYGGVTTDNGGVSTDFIDAPGGDFRLATNAAARGVGAPQYMDIGATQIEASGSVSNNESSFTFIG